MKNTVKRYELLLIALFGACCGVFLLAALVLTYEKLQRIFLSLG